MSNATGNVSVCNVTSMESILIGWPSVTQAVIGALEN